LRVADELVETQTPSDDELDVMHEIDPNHFWTR
jgi:hypothetical protein